MDDSKQQQRKKNYRKRSAPTDKDELPQSQSNNESDDERERRFLSHFNSTILIGKILYQGSDFTEPITLNRMALEEIKLLQKQRERKSGIPANPSLQVQSGTGGGLAAKAAEKNDGDGGDKDELVLQDTFAQETAVMDEDPNMCVNYINIVFVAVVVDVVATCLLNRVNYIEHELAKKRGRKIDAADQAENELKRAEDELYKIPEHLKVSVSSLLFFFHFLVCRYYLRISIMCTIVSV